MKTNNEEKPIKSNLMSELEKSKSERMSEQERAEREKILFADSLKNSLGKEIKSVLSEKKEIEKNPPKKSLIKRFFEKLRKTCQ